MTLQPDPESKGSKRRASRGQRSFTEGRLHKRAARRLASAQAVCKRGRDLGSTGHNEPGSQSYH